MKLTIFEVESHRLGLFDNYISDPNKNTYTTLKEVVDSVCSKSVNKDIPTDTEKKMIIGG